MNDVQNTIVGLEEKQIILDAQHGDESALERLVQKFTPLINSLASRLYCGANSLVSREELIQSGYVGLITAISRFDTTKNNVLSTYALPWILGEIRRTIKRNMVLNGCYEQIIILRRKQEAFEKEFGRSPTATELSNISQIPLWLINTITSADAGVHYEEDMSVSFIQSSEKEENGIPFEKIAIRIALDSMNREERQVILLRFFRDKSQKETAAIVGKSQAQISKIERKAIDHLKQALA